MGGNQGIFAVRSKKLLSGEERKIRGLGPNCDKGHEEDFELNPVNSGKLLSLFKQGNTRRKKGKALTTSGNQNPSACGFPSRNMAPAWIKSELCHLLTLNLDRLLTSSIPQFLPL